MINSRRKGIDFERWVAQQYREWWPSLDVFRGQQGDGARDPDVNHDLLWSECKRGRRPNIRAALEQAIRDTDGRIPVAVTKADRDQPIASLRLTDFLALVHAAMPTVLKVRGEG